MSKLVSDNEFNNKYIEAINLINNDDYLKAEKLFEELYDNSSKMYGYNSNITIEIMYRLAQTYYFLGKYNKSRSAYQSVISFYEENKDYENEFYLRSLLEISEILKEECKYEQALENCLSVLKTSLKIYGEDNDFTYSACTNTAEVYICMEKYDDAIALLNHELNILENIKTEENDKGSIAFIFNMLGNIYENKMELKKALEFYEKTHEMFLNEDKTENFQSINSLNNISSIYSSFGMYTELFEMRKKIYHETKRFFGENTRNTNTAKKQSCSCLLSSRKL